MSFLNRFKARPEHRTPVKHFRVCGFLGGAVLLSLAALASAEENEPGIMPLSEVEPGMRGEWKTVVSGTEVESFPLRVVGVGENFLGPNRSLIICEALDEKNLVTGPVSGMSGSPVYIDGKLIGAYAYGFTWPKEQALIGVTPIEDMFEVWEHFGGERLARRSHLRDGWRWEGMEELPREARGEAMLRRRTAETDLPSGDRLREMFKPLPTPLFVSGISPSVLGEFEPLFRERGVTLETAPMGRASSDMDAELKPGSAVAGLLMSGDFNFAATGTVTHRRGDEVLAFGHAFLGDGDSAIPMAAAEVMTIVQSVVSSFKLSNTGPVVGSFRQDRTTGVAGMIGEPAPVTEMEVRVRNGRSGEERSYRGDMFENETLTPLISALALSDTLTQTKRSGGANTIRLEARWEIEGEEPFVRRNVAVGVTAPLVLAFEHLFLYDQLMGNPFDFPRIERLVFDVVLEEEERLSELHSVQPDRTRFRGGEEVELLLRIRHYRGDETVERVKIPVPERTRNGKFTVFVGDAPASRRIDERRETRPTDFRQFVDSLRDHYSFRDITIKVMEEVPGLAVEGDLLPDLPPSVSALYGRGAARAAPVRWKTLWEDRITLDGEFRGEYRRTFDLE